MSVKDKQMVLSFLRKYPQMTSLSVLAYKLVREKEGRELFSTRDDEKTKEARLRSARKRALRIITRITCDEPELIMELKLPVQSQTAEFYSSCALKVPASETYYSLNPQETEGSDG